MWASLSERLGEVDDEGNCDAPGWGESESLSGSGGSCCPSLMSAEVVGGLGQRTSRAHRLLFLQSSHPFYMSFAVLRVTDQAVQDSLTNVIKQAVPC